jgi:hypothetical protein
MRLSLDAIVFEEVCLLPAQIHTPSSVFVTARGWAKELLCSDLNGGLQNHPGRGGNSFERTAFRQDIIVLIDFLISYGSLHLSLIR